MIIRGLIIVSAIVLGTHRHVVVRGSPVVAFPVELVHVGAGRLAGAGRTADRVSGEIPTALHRA